ncbi:FecR family protein [Pseudomonas akapageensis]|uniref:FecR family protein n=1 Tax=Pseudomonas akapageensis TaxID=2609961 RepID=UPI00140D2A64|nr:FecR family protein [Pseudomonas akapageensis]
MKENAQCPCGTQAVSERAAWWFAREQDGALEPEQRTALDAWLAEHPQHRHEYALLQHVWNATDLLSRARLQALCEPDPVPQLPVRAWRRYAVAASFMVVAIGAGLWSWQQGASDYQASFQTAMGERRQVVLPDGSKLDLNGRTRIDVHFEARRRSIELQQGEVMFSVEHDSARPFVVQAGGGSVTVTGTRFDVRRDPEQTRVAVESGTVRVQGREGGQGAPVTLTAGLGSRISTGGDVAAAYAVNTDDLTAWRSGKLVFNDAPLSEVVLEVSRYRDKPVSVAAGKAANLRLSSVFKADDTDALLRVLPSILPVKVQTLADGSTEIIAR